MANPEVSTTACVSGANDSCGGNCTNCTDPDIPLWTWTLTSNPWSWVAASLYFFIFLAGMVGNGLVIYVIIAYAKMKTVTNMYILNLATADICFLVGLPMLIVTSLLESWVFGYPMCKIFFILTAINQFTSVFCLTVTSADRYLAICHPVKAMDYRTPVVARVVCLMVWILSFLFMLPLILYSTTSVHPNGAVSCTIEWPGFIAHVSNDVIFIWYVFIPGFAIPVSLISVFYAMVVLKLEMMNQKKSNDRKRSHKKVTVMVLTVITVYVVCWLPYWVYQITITLLPDHLMGPWALKIYLVITIFSYANSMMNPILYAFLSDNFRDSFKKAFRCVSDAESGTTFHGENSVAAKNRKKKNERGPNGGGKIEANEKGNLLPMQKRNIKDNEATEFTTVSVTPSNLRSQSIVEKTDCRPPQIEELAEEEDEEVQEQQQGLLQNADQNHAPDQFRVQIATVTQDGFLTLENGDRITML